jgi:sulfonate transport system substrate-binding protein
MRKPAIITTVAAIAAAASLLLSGCVAGEGSAAAPVASSTDAVTKGGTLNIDFATYNPLSLVIKKEGWLEKALKKQDITVNWVQSAGSNKANEALRSGAVDVGSTALRCSPARTALPSRRSTSSPSPSGRPSSSVRTRASRR